jgi:hypothetical protein
MKMSSKIISTAVSGGLLSCFFVGTMTDVSHLLFADDTLFFCGADPNPLRNRGSLFLCFDVVSGLKTNLAKLDLVLVENVDNVARLAGILGCRVALPMKYLDLLLLTFYKVKHMWDGIIEQIECRLAS